MISFTEDKLPSRTLIFSNHVNSSSCCFRWLCSCSCCFFFCFCLGRFERDRRRGSCQAHSVVLLGLVRRQNVVNKSYIVHRRSQCPTVILAALSLRNPHALAVLCPCSLRGLSVLSPCSLRALIVLFSCFLRAVSGRTSSQTTLAANVECVRNMAQEASQAVAKVRSKRAIQGSPTLKNLLPNKVKLEAGS